MLSDYAIEDVFLGGMSFDPSSTQAVDAFDACVFEKQFPQVTVGNEVPRFVKELGHGESQKEPLSYPDKIPTVRGNV